MLRPRLHKIASAFILCTLMGCTSVPEIVSSPETFAVCKAADVVTTAYILENGGVELNPVVKPLVAHGVFPLALVSLGMYWLFKQDFVPPGAVAIANVGTCGAVVHNLMHLP